MRVKTVSATEQLPLSTAFDYNNVSRTSSKESTPISGRELSVLACVSFIIGVFAVQLQQQEHTTPSPVPPYTFRPFAEKELLCNSSSLSTLIQPCFQREAK